MAPPNPTYDPLKTVEGMLNGSLTRIAYYFKDRKLYGEQTVSVLRETSKKYQDALDDCEIQILYAKWHLESQLALNQARRAPKEPDPAPVPSKRKLDLTTASGSAVDGIETSAENPAKRIKIQDNNQGSAIVIHDSPDMGSKRTIEASGTTREGPGEKAASKRQKLQKPKAENDTTMEGLAPSKNPANLSAVPPPIKSDPDGPNSQEGITTATSAKDPPQDDPKAATQDALNGNSEEFDFDSMFAEATANGEQNNNANNNTSQNNPIASGSNKPNVKEDLNFDLDLNQDSFTAALNDPNSGGQANQSSLNSLLPGLETYANSTGDDLLMNFPSSSTAVAETGLNATSNTFDLPEIGESSFDDFFNEQNMGDGMDGGGGAEDMLNDDSMMNIGEFDDSFFD